MRRRFMHLGVALALLASLAACSGDETEAAPTSTTTTAVSTTTMAPTTVTEQTDPDEGPFPAGEPVDLLVLTDSSGWGIAERYAPLAAEALDREVRVHDWARGGEAITAILDTVQSTGGAHRVAEAEIIVVYGSPGGLEYDLPEPNILSCFEAADAVLWPEEYAGDWTPGTKWEPTPVVATLEDWQPYRDVLDQVFDEIWKLRGAQPTIIRTYDVPLGYGAAWTELGIGEECTANLTVQGQVVQEAAEAHGAGFVSVMDVFMGPNHDEDPVEKGWMQDDLMHANETGQDIVAETLAGYGFALSQPPTATAGASVVFDFSQNSICDWFTGEEMALIVTEAQETAGVEMDFGVNWSCQDVVWYSSTAEVWLEPHQGASESERFVAHEMLDDSVSYAELRKTQVWNVLKGAAATLRVEGHGDLAFRYVAGPDPAASDTSPRGPLGFAIADAMLKHMNWVP